MDPENDVSKQKYIDYIEKNDHLWLLSFLYNLYIFIWKYSCFVNMNFALCYKEVEVYPSHHSM